MIFPANLVSPVFQNISKLKHCDPDKEKADTENEWMSLYTSTLYILVNESDVLLSQEVHSNPTSKHLLLPPWE